MVTYKDFLRSRRYEHAAAVTPSDATVIANCDALWVGGGGTVIVDTVGGETSVTFTVPMGTLLKVSATKVHAASTATGLVALWSLVGS